MFSNYASGPCSRTILSGRTAVAHAFLAAAVDAIGLHVPSSWSYIQQFQQLVPAVSLNFTDVQLMLQLLLQLLLLRLLLIQLLLLQLLLQFSPRVKPCRAERATA